MIILITITVLSNAQDFGQPDHPMNKDSENRAVLDYWGTTSETDKLLYEFAYKVLSSKKYTTYADLSHDGEFNKLVSHYQRILLGGPMLGNVKPNGVSVWLRTVRPSKVEVEVASSGFIKTFGPVYSSSETDLSAVVEISGLQPTTNYTYRVIIDNEAITQSENHHFRTLPEENEAASVKVAFGSCPHRWGLGNRKLLDRIQSRGNQAMLLLGDIAVQDRNDHLGMHRADYLLRDFLPAWKRFSASVPVYASWDDHDYFDNDKSGIPKGYTQKDKEGVREVFRNSWVNPSYGLEEEGKGIFMRSRIGPFDVIMTDNRYFRTGEEGSFLGDPQMKWLKEQLLDCKGPFIILSCGSMWSDFVSNGKDSWGKNDPDGRKEIFRFIEENNISGVLLISGDRHGARGFTIPQNSGFGFYEFEAASLGARVGPPATDPSWDTQLYGIDGKFAFGEFTYLPSDDDPTVVFRLVGEEGNTLYERTLRKSELTPK